MERKRLMTQAGWESEYQQNPIVVGGGVIPIEKLGVLSYFDKSKIKRSVRYIDKASTEGGQGAFTAAVLMHQLRDLAHCERALECTAKGRKDQSTRQR